MASALKVKCGNAKGRLTRAAAFAEAIDESITIEMLEIRLNKLETTWSEYSSLHNEILEKAEDEEVSELESEFSEYELKYFVSNAELVKAIRDREKTSTKPVEVLDNSSAFNRLAEQQSAFLEKINSSSPSSNNSNTSKLPTIVVPPFSGCYKDWPSFRDIYLGSVDTKVNLSPTHKFHYLKSYLRDDAANLIKHLKINDANYSEAWDRLERRYDRSQLIVQSFIETFLSLPTANNSNVQTLRKISDGADEVVRGLSALDKTGRDPWLIYLLLNKLDSDTKQAWAENIGSREDVTVVELLDFLELRCNAFEACQSLSSRSGSSRTKQSNNIRAHLAGPSDSISKSKCPMCQDNHVLTQCTKFVALDIDSRRSFAKTNSLCFNCLKAGHSSQKCFSTFRCRVCRSRHHSLVHPDDAANTNQVSLTGSSNQTQSSSSTSAQSNTTESLVSNHSLDVSRPKKTLLPTILARIQDNQGNLIDCRVLLDSGSQSTFIVESFAQRLGYHRKHSRIPILGLSSTEVGYTKGLISLNLRSRVNSSHLFVDAFILDKLTSNLPTKLIDVSSWSHIQNLDLADPTFNVAAPIDVLLGGDKLWSILKDGQIRGPNGCPIAQRTSFGWVITGQFFEPEESNHFISFHSLLDLSNLMQRFWEVEEVFPANSSIVFDQAEEHFQLTFSRSPDRKYVVHLPFKTPNPSFKNTLSLAVSRLFAMERRFAQNSKLRDLYSDFMREYIGLGHMIRIPRDEIKCSNGRCFYLPHHAVLKPDSSSTKLRVVFDGSAKDSTGNSLNNALLIGPPIQRDLIGVCLRFRQHPFVFTADVVKMFRQIWVDDSDCDYQRIVWRDSPSKEIEHFRLRTVTYGTASAPFLSVRVLKQLAEDYKSEFPNAARVLLEDVYVDDVMTGAKSPKDLIELKSELVTLLSMANLELRKWSSNCWPLLASLPKEQCEYSFYDTERSNSYIKVLGMHWNPSNDEYSFRISKSLPTISLTRRSLLSEVSRIFDPLGLLAPSVVLFKMLFQELWSSKLKLGWDDPLPPELADRWDKYRKEIWFFEQVQIPRNLFTSSFDDIELHGFCDASTLAYGAVLYTRCKVAEGKYNITIVAAKTKVAPLKPVSIPRLELCGALLLTRLLSLVKSSFSYKFTNIVAWCDSEIVLHWLSSPPRRWVTFVANRTAAILEVTPRSCWRHISSESNPADCASRGVIPSNLPNHPLWWTGPSWLRLEENAWPEQKFVTLQQENNDILLEQRLSPLQVLQTSAENFDVIDHIISKTSSWFRMQRILAYVIRFIFNYLCEKSKPKRQRRTSYLTLKEIHVAKTTIIKSVQLTSFSEDIRTLTLKKELPLKSKLLKYSPFLDNKGLLRVGGRIKNANISFNIKHPYILPINDFSHLIIEDIHKKNLHPGVSATFAIVRQQYWILGSRNLTRKIVFKCTTCFKLRKTTSSQLMGDLPSQRVSQSRPFSHTGCDYAGPLCIKLSRGRNPKTSKAYICLFVCMATKAIHLELVSDLTSDAFLAAFRRFVSRRGLCSNVYSDNGTNFQGARRCLNEMHKLVISEAYNEAVATSLAKDNVTWNFIPPSSPHFGGLWEAGVKSVKCHLRRVIGASILTFEEMYTVLTQIEAILNSRPLCVISDNDLNPLTPAHFLIGEPFTAVPEPTTLSTPLNRLSHWNHLQNMVQGFWKRWHVEYITTLQERSKWKTATPNLKPGDLVIIKEPNLPPTKWLLGKIEAATQGTDGRVRVATVKTNSGTFVRPITKLALLPIS
ncbi:uncharacterized protein LOC129911250 [Episyrphus balteatus]|uniref:uncharacterized protein LOC129911250 n=1 Tax=Episyrphus balteatus TaxID=286459 RepID=UPI00248663C4|nr:uncharacterized protein LOC129911250 [Episyrphus balteatus]